MDMRVCPMAYSRYKHQLVGSANNQVNLLDLCFNYTLNYNSAYFFL